MTDYRVEYLEEGFWLDDDDLPCEHCYRQLYGPDDGTDPEPDFSPILCPRHTEQDRINAYEAHVDDILDRERDRQIEEEEKRNVR